MSRSCYIQFSNDDEESILTYKHNDGYPDANMDAMADFWNWYPRRPQLSEVVPNWFLYEKYRVGRLIGEGHDIEPSERSAKGYQILHTNTPHSDLRHFYEFNIDENKVDYFTTRENEFQFNIDIEPSEIPEKYDISRTFSI